MSSHLARARHAALATAFAIAVAGFAAAPNPSSIPAAPRMTMTAAVVRSSAADGPTAKQVAALDKRLRRTKESPAYSEKVTLRVMVDDQTYQITSGRQNQNTKVSTGHFTVRTSATGSTAASTYQTVTTTKATYLRKVKANGDTGKWREALDAPGDDTADSISYARLLLKKGPAAIKGHEVVGGARTTRISGRVTLAQVRKLEPRLYPRLKKAGVTSFRCDIWVDRSGHAVKVQQWFKLKNYSLHNVITFSDFGDPFVQKKPTN